MAEIKIKTGTESWWEADSHVSTGVDTTGRIYFKHLANKKGYNYQINILIKTQKYDLEQLV